jgi:protein ImuB
MFAVIHLPNFPLQAALRLEPELSAQPVVLVDSAEATPKVAALSRRAAEAGVTEGLSPVQAMARCADVHVRHRSLEQEARVTETVLQCAQAFSPYVELTGPGIFTLDLRSLAALTGADADRYTLWAGQLSNAIKGLNLRPQIGLGTTPNMARHAARWTDTVQIVDDPKTFLASLPLAALDPSSEVMAVLKRWGIATVGELHALDRLAVTERLGLEALDLFAAASVTALRPLRLAWPKERFEENHDFEQPVEILEPLLFILRQLTEQLGHRLAGAGLVAQQLALRLRLESGTAHETLLRLPEPSRLPEVLFRMLHTHLETVRTDTGVVGLGLAIDPGQPTERQFSLFETVVRDPARLQDTLARLSALLGPDRVGTPARIPGHRRDAFRMAAPDFENLAVAPSAGPAQPERIPWRQLRPGRPAAVQVEPGTNQPVEVRGTPGAGAVQAATGPWRASGHWWEPEAWWREDWEVATATGEVQRLTRTAEGWQLTGVLD